MGIFSQNKDRAKLVLVFDVGSSSVGGALFWMQKSGVPRVILTVCEPIALAETIDADRFLSSAVKSLKTVAGKICLASMGVPENIFCILSSPWYVSQTRVIKLEKNTPFVFTSKLADDLIKKEIDLFEEEHLAKHKATKSPVRSIELKNIKTMLNGYETSNPLDQKAKELEMTVFISMAGENIIKKIEEAIRGHFHFQDIKFSSFAMASFTVVRDMCADQENFLLIDIGGEITDISMVKKNILHESVSFPVGLNSMIREVASILGCSLGEAESYISLFKDGHGEQSVTKKLGQVIGKFKLEWLHKFQESLANLSNDISIPANIYMAVDQDLADFFRQTIENEQFNQYTLTDSKFKIIFLGADVFHDKIKFKDDTIRDPFLIIDSIYINRSFN